MYNLLALLLAAGLSLASKDHATFRVEDLLAAPRAQAPIPNPAGDLVLAVIDRWNATADTTTRSVYTLAPNATEAAEPTGLFNTTTSAASDFLWLNNDTFAYLNGSSLYTVAVDHTHGLNPDSPEPRHLFDSPSGISASGLQYNAETGILAFSAKVWADGEFSTAEDENEAYAHRGTTGVVYDELFIRHWDTWRTPGQHWTIGITKIHKGINGFSPDKHQIFDNVLNGTGLYNQMDPITFALSTTHLAFAIKAPHLNPATHTREDVYILPLSHPTSRPTHLTPHDHGAISGLTFSPDGKKLAWLEMAQDGYESDKRVLVVHDSEETMKWTQAWDRSPHSVVWSRDSKSVYLLAEHEGKVLPYHLTHAGRLPTPMIFNHTTTSISPLPSSVLLSMSSMISPLDYFLLPDKSPKGNDDKLPRELHRLSSWGVDVVNGSLAGSEPEEFWFEGSEGWRVMGWVNKPRGWKAGQEKMWPMAFLIHGGPQGAWTDSWSTRWSPAIFASMGYFVVSVNPTGSTGYGQEFTDRIQAEWGGRPYKDLVAGYHAALESFPEIDAERTAALGASYGGYMVNWMNGHNPGFKAFVCHDGIFSTTDAFYTTEELWFPLHDLKGSPINNRALYEKWNPMNHVAAWSTPQLVIHGGKDFRLIEGSGIAAFTALQYQGVPSRFLYFPDENHWVLKASNSRKWHYEVFRWLDEWVGAGRRDADEAGGLVIQEA